MPSISREDYLKTIFQLSGQKGESVSTGDISRALNITKPAISEMAKKMKAKGWLKYKRYRGIQLTEDGRLEAMKIIRKHRLWESFLTEVLGYCWDEVHEEAERLEHSTSDKLADRLSRFLGFPTFDPHGDPIPSAEGHWPDHLSKGEICLARIEKDTPYRVSRVLDKDKDFLQLIGRLGIRLNSMIKLLQRYEFDNSISIFMNDKELLLSPEISKRIFVIRLER